MGKVNEIVEAIRKLNGLDAKAVRVPDYPCYDKIIYEGEPRLLLLPAGYYFDGQCITNRGNTGKCGFWTFKVQPK